MTAPAIVVRDFHPDDAAAVARALVDSSIQHTELEPERYVVLDAESLAARYRAGQQHPRGVPPDERASFVAEVDGVVVGILDVHVATPQGAHRPDRYGFVAELAIAAPARGRGAGEALLRAAEDWARAHECAYTVLDYNVRNARAGRFYGERMGYRPAGVIVIKDLRQARG